MTLTELIHDRGFVTFTVLFVIAVWITGFVFCLALCKAAAKPMPSAFESTDGAEMDSSPVRHELPARSDATADAYAKPLPKGAIEREFSKIQSEQDERIRTWIRRELPRRLSGSVPDRSFHISNFKL